MLILSCLLSMRLRTSIAEYNASFQRCSKTSAEKRRIIRYRQNLFFSSLNSFFLDSVVVFSYYLEIFMHPYRDICHTEAKGSAYAKWSNTMAISLSSL